MIARELFNATRGGAPLFKFFFTGPSLLSLSDDNGVTFSAPTAIYSPGTNAQTIDNLVQVTPNGNVYDFLHRYQCDAVRAEHRLCLLVEQGDQLEHAGLRARYPRRRGGQSGHGPARARRLHPVQRWRSIP